MNFSRPALAVFASVVASAACSGTETPTPGNTAGSVGTAGSNPSGGSGVSGSSSTAGTGMSTGGSTAGTASTAGSSNTGGSTAGSGGSGTAGSGTAGSGGSGAGTGGGGGSGGLSSNAEGPCDIYAKGNTPCVAAYSTVRRLLSTYMGPLYQVRSGSNAMNNTGMGGMTHDIPQKDGFADIAAQATACANTICTVSKLYDQSGKGNDIIRAVKGLPGNGPNTDKDNYETTIGRADMKDKIKVGGRDVYSLYMEAYQGYRQTVIGNGMPVDKEPQGIYMVADGTRTGDACCWDFGNVTRDPTTYHVMNTLFFGVGYWGEGSQVKSPGAPLPGPWFGADIEAGVWMGGSVPSDPGWGAIPPRDNPPPPPPPNEKNPSLFVKYALGFLKTGNTPDRYALRMADVQTATMVTTAYAGAYPQGRQLDSQGSVGLGIGGDNSNNSWSTFYEGAIVAGFPTDATEDAILQNLKALRYGQ